MQEDPSHPPHFHMMTIETYDHEDDDSEYSGLANLEKDFFLLPLLHRLCDQQGHESAVQVMKLSTDILDMKGVGWFVSARDRLEVFTFPGLNFQF